MTKDLWGYGVPGPGERTAAQWTPLIDDDGSEMLDHPSGMKALTFPGNGNGVHHWHVRSRSGKNVAKGRSATPQEAESSALHVMENPPPPYRYGPDDLEFGRYRHRGTDYQDGMAMVWPRGEFHGPDNWLSAITWGPSGEIGNVETHPDHRRRGLATQLFDYVKQNHRPDLRHSPTLSEDGKAWSRYEQSRTAMPTYYHRSPTHLQEQRPDRAMPHTYFYTADDPHDVDWETRAYGDQVYAADLPAEVMEPDPAPRRAQDSPVRWWRTDPANVGDMTHLYDPTAPFWLPTKKVRP